MTPPLPNRIVEPLQLRLSTKLIMPQHLPLLLLVILHARVSAFTCRDVSGRASLIHSSVDVPYSFRSLFWSNNRARCNGRYSCPVELHASSDKGRGDGAGGVGKKGYRFGDLTKSLIGGSVEKVRILVHIIRYSSEEIRHS